MNQSIEYFVHACFIRESGHQTSRISNLDISTSANRDTTTRIEKSCPSIDRISLSLLTDRTAPFLVRRYFEMPFLGPHNANFGSQDDDFESQQDAQAEFFQRPLLQRQDSSSSSSSRISSVGFYESQQASLLSGDIRRSDPLDVSRATVLSKIEDMILFETILNPLQERQPPAIGPFKTFVHNTHCRVLTNICLVADFCHELLLSHRTTTIREVYYHFVTHFRNQAECDKAIWDLSHTLRVPRSALGLTASPKGWCCGCLELYDPQSGDLMWNGRNLDVHGMPVTIALQHATVQSDDAKCILVIEKEGVYNRLSEDRFFLGYPCILVTGKGFPDIATRQWVHHLHRILQIPVYGLCDANPYGVSVLHTYQYLHKAGQSFAVQDDSDDDSQEAGSTQYSLPMQWLGLRPSQVESLDLPPSVFQNLTDLDHKRLNSFLEETHPFQQQGQAELRRQELEDMMEGGHKVELEALNWLGMDFLARWLQNRLQEHDRLCQRQEFSDVVI